MTTELRLYYWDERRNFGDLLSPLLLKHFAQLKNVEHASPTEADIVCVGSVLDVLPQKGWRGVVAGSGKLHKETRTDLTDAHVMGLRGFLTLADVTLRPVDRRNIVIGDPGLLVTELVNPNRGRYPLGCVPHVTDTELFPRELARARREHYAEPLLIDPAGDPLTIITQIASCQKIISSSLHGVITADAFGIPRRTERFPAMFNRYEGGDFKFADYGSSINQSVQIGVLQEAPRNRVEQLQYELFGMLESV